MALSIRRTRLGLTLLEVILATALSAFLIGMLGMAISVTLRFADARRTNVEEAALARGVLQQISADIRGAVYPAPVDFSGLEELAAEVATDALDGVEDAGEITTDDAATTDEEAEAGITENNLDIASSAVASPVLGVYGNQFELQIDVSRPPRIEEYEQVLGGLGDVTDIPSDVKTVSWYVMPRTVIEDTEGLAPSPVSFGATDFSQGGLVRRELDRAVTAYAAQNGGDQLQQAAELLAPEVVSVEFSYFDGTAWATFWDSQARGGLPFAVQVRIGIQKAYQPEGDLSDLNSFDPNGGISYYSTTVHIPTAIPLVDPAVAAAEEAAAEEEAAAAEAAEGAGS